MLATAATTVAAAPVTTVAAVATAAGACTAADAPASAAAATSRNITVIRDESLYKSEPNPSWFGNPANPPATSDAATHWSNDNWLKSRFHFSFAEYRTGRSNLGPLRVLNDDLVQPRRGFGEHPHGDMEIVTFVIDGLLTHKDSMGTAETLGRGDVQFMTAGTGVRHSEHNLSPDRPLRFAQIWVQPRRRGLPPNYGSAKGDPARRRNRWHHILTDVRGGGSGGNDDVDDGNAASAGDEDDIIRINQDVNMFVADVGAGRALPAFEVAPGRQAYLLCVRGREVALTGGRTVSTHDAATIRGGTRFTAHNHDRGGGSGGADEKSDDGDADEGASDDGAGSMAQLLLIELPHTAR